MVHLEMGEGDDSSAPLSGEYRAAKPSSIKPAEGRAHPSDLHELRDPAERLRLEVEHLLDEQAALIRERDELLDHYDNAPLPLLHIDRAGTIRSANIAVASLLGEDKGRLSGMSLRAFVHSADRLTFTVFLTAARKGEPATCEVKLVCDEPLPVQLWARSALATDLLQVAMIDLRDRNRDETERRDLVESERRAREASTSKDQFIAMLSHELRTPLTPVLAAAAFFKNEQSLSKEVRAIFEMIERNISVEARLVDDLLDATGIARGKILVLREPLDMHCLLMECVQHVNAEILAKRLEMHVVLEATQTFVNGDDVRLRQVVLNLLRNAIKFTPKAGAIHLRSWNRDGFMVVDIEDTGRGFDPREAERLFKQFDQLRDTASPHGGLGLGLAISKGLIELHGGRITGSSRGVGRGARFTFELSTAPPSIAPPPLPSSPSGNTDGVRILLVEDHEDTAEMLTSLLQLEGFEVVWADTVRGALAAELEKVDLIVSDLGLPDGTGFELIEKLRQLTDKPAIALSGFGMTGDVHQAKKKGFDMHMTKPVDMRRLLQAIRELLAPSAPD